MDLIASLQELIDLGVGFVSLTEALDLRTSLGRAMAGMLAVFAAFERDILRERVRAGLAHAKRNGKKLADPQLRHRTLRRSENCIAIASANLRSHAAFRSGVPQFVEFYRQQRRGRSNSV